jgi:FKBP-type peptidyl-prolyl cis-trans isomerase 2
MSVTIRNIVRIDCELTLAEGGDVIESSKKTGPVEYKHGAGQMLAGLEKRLEGMTVGEEKSGVIPAAEAFGTEESQPTMTIPRAQFPNEAKIEVGAQFEAKSPQGTPLTLRVTSIEEEKIIAQVVHPLAGKDVAFKVKVLSIRPPPPPVPKSQVEELDSAEFTAANEAGETDEAKDTSEAKETKESKETDEAKES